MNKDKNNINLIGQKFNQLTVIGFSNKVTKNNDKYWLCQCDCEKKTIKDVREYHLINNNIKSCGCLSIRRRAEENKLKHFKYQNLYYKQIFSTYDAMRKRCYNTRHENYKHYGGRGITICNDWLNDFMNFYNWAIENNYEEGLTIDRIDVNGNYEPNNCRWATKNEQSYNKTTTAKILVDGEIVTYNDLINESGLPYYLLYQRYTKFNKTTRKELFKPQPKKIKLFYNGEMKTFYQLSLETNIHPSTLKYHYKKGDMENYIKNHT